MANGRFPDYMEARMHVEHAKREDRHPRTVVVAAAAGGLQLWMAATRDSSDPSVSDRTVAMWVHDDGESLCFGHPFHSPLV